jgi:hypothetical protein
LNAEKARYLIVGGFAVMLHTEPRFTKDLDVWVEPTPTNAVRVWSALARFGAPLRDVSPDVFTRPGNFFVIGVIPNRIDVLTHLTALEFPKAWRRRRRASYGGVRAGFLAAEDLLRNKRAVGRPQDLLDAEKLEIWMSDRRRRRRRRSGGTRSPE